ncbi:MAG: hypothetical protein AB7I30_01385 [Isosphaeraceae bacterium]
MSVDPKPYVHYVIDAVDTVLFDPEGRLDPNLHDRYATFESARDAALSSVELMLDAGDYDGDDHREELERMGSMLEASTTIAELEEQPGFRWFLERLDQANVAAA